MRNTTLGILGIAHVHSETYIQCILHNPDASIVSIYDSDTSQLEAIHTKYDIPISNTAQEVLALRPDIILICSENTNHLAMVRLAAQAGIDVICEKPLATSVDDLHEMLHLAKTQKIRLMTAFPNRYIHAYDKLLQVYNTGSFGKILGIKATNKGEMPGSWFIDKELSGGGCIIDHTVHVADLLNNLFDSLPISVHAIADRRLYPDIEVEDVALVSFTYPNGVAVSLDSSWSRMPSFPYARDLTLHVVGTEDSCTINYFAESYKVYSQDANKAVLHYYGEDKDQKMIDHLISCYQQGKDFPITGISGCKSSLVAIAALRSVELGRTVLLSEIITPELKELLS